jgi:hypothetical protein
MRKDATYKEKFILLKPWLPLLISTVKKDLKNDHLKRDLQFCKRYLAGKNPAKLSDAELTTAYAAALEESENGEAIGEFIANRWLLKMGDIYHFFEQNLSAIAPNFTDLEELSHADAKRLSEAAVAEFGAPNSYLFAVINSVVFPESQFQALAKQAEVGREHEEKRNFEFHEKMSLEAVKTGYEQQIARLTDKYEKKLSGLQKKYSQDTEALKKQLAQLQRKLK